MKNLFKKTGKLFLTLLVLLNSAFQITPVFAEENDPIDYSEAVETITELGPAEEVFPEIYAEETENPKLRLTPGFGSDRIVRINGVGVYGYDYIRILTVGGNDGLGIRNDPGNAFKGQNNRKTVILFSKMFSHENSTT